MRDERELPFGVDTPINVPQLPGYTPAGSGQFLGTGTGSDSFWERTRSDARALTPRLDAVQGIDEHIGLLRQIANVVETRSDVYIVTYVLRGYDPDVIRRVPITGDIDETLQNPLLAAPAYESRRLVVYDRSNVRRPLDRPNVLLSVELPPARP